MGDGWSTRLAADGVVELDAHDGRGWYRWTEPGVKAYEGDLGLPACPHCNDRHAPPFDGACLI